MGNYICTDSVPFTEEDIMCALRALPKVSVVNQDEILTRDELRSFRSYDHNVKAFRFFNGNTTENDGASKGKKKAMDDSEVNSELSTSASNYNLGNTAEGIGMMSKTKDKKKGSKTTRRGSTSSSKSSTHNANSSTTSNRRERKARAVSFAGNSANIVGEPVSLSRPLVYLKDTDVYLVIEVHRLSGTSNSPPGTVVSPTAGALGGSTLSTLNIGGQPSKRQREEDNDRYRGEAPPWARDMTDLFTPRGLSTVFGGDFNRPTPRGGSHSLLNSQGSPPVAEHLGATTGGTNNSSTNNGSNTSGGGDFRFSIHILTGKKSHPLVAAYAFIKGLNFEKMFNESPELVRRLFYNCNFGGKKGAVVVGKPAPVGRLTMTGSDSDGTNTASGTTVSYKLPEFYTKNAVLRNLHGIVKLTPSPRFGHTSVPSSARYSMGSLTPRSARQATPSSYRASAVFRRDSLLQTMPPAIGTSASNNPNNNSSSVDVTQQGPPPLEIPKMRFITSDTRRSTAQPFVSQRGLDANHGQAATYKSSALDAEDPTNPESPRLLPNLRIGEALQDYHGGGRKKGGFYMNNADNGANIGTQGRDNTKQEDFAPLNLRMGRGNTTTNHHEDEIKHSEERLARFRQSAPEATEILPYLFVGGEEAAKDRNQLLKKGITAVVNTVHFDLPNYHSDIFNYLSLFVSDSPDEPIYTLISVVNSFIEREQQKDNGRGKILVHCHQGVSRSCSFVVAYIMWKKGMCYNEAFDLVRARRTICSPNAGFFVTLHVWESTLANACVFKRINQSATMTAAIKTHTIKFNYYVNRVFAFSPYSAEYPFPYSFRLAFTLRDTAYLSKLFKMEAKNFDLNDDDIIHPNNISFLTAEDVKVDIDERLCYGFLLQRYPDILDNTNADSYSNNPVYSFMYFGSKAPSIVKEKAKTEWRAFIECSFFRGKSVVTSIRKEGEKLQMTPAPTVRGIVGSSDTSISDVAAPVNTPFDVAKQIFEIVYSHSVVPTEVPNYIKGGKRGRSAVVETQLDWVKNLVNQKDLIFRFGQMLQAEERTENESENKQRNREEELRRVLHREKYTVSAKREGVSSSYEPSPKSAREGTFSPLNLSPSKSATAGKSTYVDAQRLAKSPRPGYSKPLGNASTSAKESERRAPDIRTPRTGASSKPTSNDATKRPHLSAAQSSGGSPFTTNLPSSGSQKGSLPSSRNISSRPTNEEENTARRKRPSLHPLSCSQLLEESATAPENADNDMVSHSPNADAATAEKNKDGSDLEQFLALPFPFVDAPDEELLFEDFSGDEVYAAFLPKGETETKHMCYLWIGSACKISTEEVLNAYYTNLVVQKNEQFGNTIQFSTGQSVRNVVEEITCEGEEPDALLCL